jgi:glycosyltransferase involved in cell wall biosynthesis
VITPSFNQGRFLEETIRSVLLQGYPDLEYLVLDGGSTDDSVEIIRKYSRWLAYYVSEADSGQSDAINRGLRRASGIFATWINSDDMLSRDALVAHATQAGFDRNTVYVGNCRYVDESGNVILSHCGRIHSLEDLLRVRTIWRSGGHIVQPEVLFPTELALQVGCLNPENHCTMDYELWGKFFLAGAKFQYTGIDFGVFRRHETQKTQDGLRQTASLLEVAEQLIAGNSAFSEERRRELLADLAAYRELYKIESWKSTGRLARIGLPRGLVITLRDISASIKKNMNVFFNRPNG